MFFFRVFYLFFSLFFLLRKLKKFSLFLDICFSVLTFWVFQITGISQIFIFKLKNLQKTHHCLVGQFIYLRKKLLLCNKKVHQKENEKLNPRKIEFSKLTKEKRKEKSRKFGQNSEKPEKSIDWSNAMEKFHYRKLVHHFLSHSPKFLPILHPPTIFLQKYKKKIPKRKTILFQNDSLFTKFSFSFSFAFPLGNVHKLRNAKRRGGVSSLITIIIYFYDDFLRDQKSWKIPSHNIWTFPITIFHKYFFFFFCFSLLKDFFVQFDESFIKILFLFYFYSGNSTFLF